MFQVGLLKDFMMTVGLLFAQRCLELISLVSGLLKLLQTCSSVQKSHEFYHAFAICALQLLLKCLKGLVFLLGSVAGWWLGFVCVLGLFPQVPGSL